MKKSAMCAARRLRMIFQDPMTSLNPVLTIGKQLAEPLMLHLGMTKKQAESAPRNC